MARDPLSGSPIARRRLLGGLVGILLTALLLPGCAVAPKTRTMGVRVPPVVVIGVQPQPLSAGLVVPDPIKSAVHREQVWCPFATVNLAIQTGAALEKGALQALPQAFRAVDLVRDKSGAAQYEVFVEPSMPEVALTTTCNWLPWQRPMQQAKVMLHVLVSGARGQVLLDHTFASQARERESPGDAIGDAYAEVLQQMVRTLAASPRIRRYAKELGADDGRAVPPPSPDRIAGLGFAAGFGYVITNYHVVAGMPEIQVLLGDKPTRASVALRDRLNDVALLRIHTGRNGAEGGERIGLTGLRLGDPGKVRAGDRVWTLALAAGSGQGTVVDGHIVGVDGPGNDRRFLQVMLPLAAGNSGSPLLNESGEVIGLMVPVADAPEGFSLPADLPKNVSLAVKASYAKSLLALLPESEFLTPAVDPLPTQQTATLADLLRPQVVLITGGP